MKRLICFALAFSSLAKADILEERTYNGPNVFLPSPFPLNPASNATNLTIFSALYARQGKNLKFILNPNNNAQDVEQNIAQKDLAIGGQYPMGGAAFGLSVGQSQRSLTARHESLTTDNTESLFYRDYRMRFSVDLTPELRGGFTFHYTSLQADLEGSYFLNDEDRTRYKGNVSGYGLGLVYAVKTGSVGAFTLPPMRGKATIEGEQKIATEPGIYGLELTFKPSERLGLVGHHFRWSYKRDERDETSTSRIDQRDILLRGLEVDQFYRKTSSTGLGAQFALTQSAFIKAYYTKQDGVFLFDEDSVPGDDPDQETKMEISEYSVGLGIKNKDFVAQLNYMESDSEIDLISNGRGEVGMGSFGSYIRESSGVGIMVGASF